MKVLNESTADIHIYGAIESEGWFSESSAQQFNDELKSLGDVSQINLYINSPGGDVFEGQAIYSMLNRHKAFVTVRVDGLAASIASVIAMAGDKIVMPNNAMLMIHDPWTFAIGNSREMRKVAADLDKINESIINTYLNKTNGQTTEENIRTMMQEETWLSADDAKAYGFIDEVTEAVKVAASIDREYAAKYKNTPKKLTQQDDLQSEKAQAYKDLIISIAQ
ncbi:Clp protease ClpP [Macrococcus equipercicus]|uniref:ATP-dependent Clp protease proteolytic subunit n=1 Tax=Macrococcus equipercicus TaxID=69967 RepID=A0ABQ6R7X3_9STAP|nr:head maturation protease, ClpP-related [Macrococcus equipercicus]KAA1039194.1 Clp protease ClpP [Macrococcus equipercicus]